MNSNANMKALVIIVNAGFSEAAMDIARSCGARGGTIINARGSGAQIQSILGMHVEPEKEMILSVVSEEAADKIMREIRESRGIKTSAGGICFCMPVDQMTQIDKANS